MSVYIKHKQMYIQNDYKNAYLCLPYWGAHHPSTEILPGEQHCSSRLPSYRPGIFRQSRRANFRVQGPASPVMRRFSELGGFSAAVPGFSEAPSLLKVYTGIMPGLLWFELMTPEQEPRD